MDLYNTAAAIEKTRNQKKKTLSACYNAIPSCIEWYDYCLFIYLMPYMAHIFFSNINPTLIPMISFGTIALGFVTRSLGGMYYGTMADKKGRRISLIYATRLMILPTLLILLMPGYQTIGVIAPILLCLSRLIQGFSIGGEYTGLCVIAFENSQKKRRAHNLSIINVAASVGILLSSIVISLLSFSFAKQTIIAWAWRIPFLIGLTLTILSLYIQSRMDESSEFLKIQKVKQQAKSPIQQALQNHPHELLLAFILQLMSSTIYYSIATFLPLFLQQSYHFNHQFVMLNTTIGSTCYIICVVLFARIVDRRGEKNIMIAAITCLCLFWLLFYQHLLINQFSALLLFFVTTFTLASAISITVTRFNIALFPIAIRATAFSSISNISSAIAGSLPFFYSVAIHQTGCKTIPLYVIVTLSALALFWITVHIVRTQPCPDKISKTPIQS